MSKPAVSEEEQKQRIDRAQEWQRFRTEFNFSQKLLADTLRSIDTRKDGRRIGISRRTVQQIEAGIVTPHRHTIDLFDELKRRHSSNKSS